MISGRTRTVGFTLLASALVVWASLPVHAATITAANCGLSAVQSAINSTQHGDTVVIPAGTCTWTSALTVTKGITLTGAGIDVTKIIDNVTTDMLILDVNAPNRAILSHLTIVGHSSFASRSNVHLAVSGSQTQFRIHHVKFQIQKGRAMWIRNALGLIDHVTSLAPSIFSNFAMIEAASTFGGTNYGDKSWAEPTNWGGSNAVFIEDSTFVGPTGQLGVTDAQQGARVVFRYNDVTDYHVGSHGLDSGNRKRSVRTMEVYRNTFRMSYSRDFITWCRGGSCLVHNNTVLAAAGKNLNQVAKAHNCRSQGGCGGEPYTDWFGMCNGSQPWDGNASGTSGYRCADQPGSGTSVDLQGKSMAELKAAPIKFQNASEPMYAWGNTFNGASRNDFGSLSSLHTVQNRDFYSGVARPGYSEYTYPHPLTNGGSTTTSAAPSAPESVRIVY